jgi:phosphoglycerol transferase MdoB-like AlkP superfamily enzyme
MAEKKNEKVKGKTFVQNLLSGTTWLRVLFMALFVLIYGVAEILLTAVVLLQIVFVLVTGEKNERLTAFGKSLSLFVFEIILFWTYNSEEKPFPFASWPVEETEA